MTNIRSVKYKNQSDIKKSNSKTTYLSINLR